MTLVTPRILLIAALLPSIVKAQLACPAHTLTQRHLSELGLPTGPNGIVPLSEGIQREAAFTIPVVVHVVWNTPEENLADAAIHGIIERLNEDLKAVNADLEFVREVYQPLIGNAGTTLCLAQRDPSGNGTTGITRTETSITWFDPDNDADKMKTLEFGAQAWAPDRYLNIWICDITSGAPPDGLYNGYAYLPATGVVGAWFDGMVLDASLATQPGNHTGTHELGHYLGLYHPWSGGGCNSTDEVDDTPTTDGPTLNCTNNALMKCGELTQYENFMDYSACKCMFTHGQVARMADVLSGIRHGLTESNGCEALPPPLSYCIPVSENGTFDDDLIDGVVLGNISNTGSGDTLGPSYTDYTGEFSTELAQGATAFISITGGGYSPDNYAAWIDYNKDTLFTDDERLLQFITNEGGQTVISGFVVPLDAMVGETRMRVRCVYQGEETLPVDPCADYGYGETEDYAVVIVEGGPSFCIPTSGSGTSDGDFIDGVVLGDIQNTATGGVGGPSYTDHSDSLSTELQVGAAATLTLTSGTYQPDHFTAWIDYDHDLLFEPEENLGHFTTSESGQTFDLDLFVPMTALTGTTRMRVRGVYHSGGEPVPTDPCFPYNWGETEDYAIVIVAGTSTLCIPTSVTGTANGDLIDGVAMGDIQNLNSGAGPAYSDLFSLQGTTLEQGSSALLSITGGNVALNTYAAWLDRNGDEIFSPAEQLGSFTTTAPGETQNIAVDIPEDAPVGAFRLRVRGVAIGEGEASPIDPCYNYALGETEDYRVQVVVPDTSFCIPTSGAGTSDGDFIDGVVIGSINNIATGGSSGPTYMDYTELITSVVPGSSYPLVITSGEYSPDQVSAWIDYDGDNEFEETERVGAQQTESSFQEIEFDVTVPSDASLGLTRLRVRCVYFGDNEPDPVDPCYAYGYGETEDYGILIEVGAGIGEQALDASLSIRQDGTHAYLAWTGSAEDLHVVDAAGRTVLRARPVGNRHQFSTLELSAGVYLAVVRGERAVRTRRFVVGH